MHICPAEIAAALFMLEQTTLMYWYLKMQLMYWYLKMQAQGFSGRLRARISALKSST
jgi:hypothetical protein